MKGLIAGMMLVAALAACMAPGTAGAAGGQPEPLAGTSWVLTELNGRPPVASPDVPTPTLAFAADRASGNGGCNQFNGSYTQAGDGLTFGPLASTRRACVNEAGNAQETAYLQALQSTTRAATSNGMLMLYAGDRLVARFRPTTG